VPGTESNIARVAWVCAATLAVFVSWIAIGPGASVGIAFFYAIPIGLATWWGGRRRGAVVAVACVGLYVAGALIHPVPDLGIALAVRVIAFLAVALLVSVAKERLTALEHSAEELEAIRAALTPSTLPELPDVDAAAAFVPSEHGVSGDFYLLTNGPDGSTIAVVGDVVGHGAPAARLATFVRARFAALTAGSGDPAELLTLVNEALLDRPGQDRELVSAACLRFSPADAMLSWAVAGHPPPLRLPELQELRPDASTLPLGASAELELINVETSLKGGGGVLIYTDGATDVRREEAPLGFEGLSGLLAPLAHFPARAMVTQIQQAILEWTDGPIRDDLCVLVLKPKRNSA
jgi:serine phosphatase RsbU (regulator of sigma subunit)